MKLEEAKKRIRILIKDDCTCEECLKDKEAYKTVLQELEELQQKEKSRIIGNINEVKIEDLETVLKPYYISKNKVKEKIEELENINTNLPVQHMKQAQIAILKALLEE